MAATGTGGWIQLATDTAGWFIQHLRSNGIRSPREIKKKQEELGAIAFDKFFQQSYTEKFEVAADKAEAFIREYFSSRGFKSEAVDQLIIQAQYILKATAENKVFQFVKKEGGTYVVYYVAMLAQDDLIYIAMTFSQFRFSLPPDYTGWWIFTKKEYRSLTIHEEQSLQSFFLYEALRNFYQSMRVDMTQLTPEDREFLEFNN